MPKAHQAPPEKLADAFVSYLFDEYGGRMCGGVASRIARSDARPRAVVLAPHWYVRLGPSLPHILERRRSCIYPEATRPRCRGRRLRRICLPSLIPSVGRRPGIWSPEAMSLNPLRSSQRISGPLRGLAK